jgi:hypothetical protein
VVRDGGPASDCGTTPVVGLAHHDGRPLHMLSPLYAAPSPSAPLELVLHARQWWHQRSLECPMQARRTGKGKFKGQRVTRGTNPAAILDA